MDLLFIAIVFVIGIIVGRETTDWFDRQDLERDRLKAELLERSPDISTLESQAQSLELRVAILEKHNKLLQCLNYIYSEYYKNTKEKE